MRSDMISQIIPHADPDFLRIMEKIPDTSPATYERVIKHLPPIYELFLEKKRAAAKGDTKKFKLIVDKEIALLKRAELD